MSGVASAHARCTETFLGERCALAVGHNSRHQRGDVDRTLVWGWADDPEFADHKFDNVIDVRDGRGNTIRTEVLP